jgi:hypothetical protein
MTMCAMSILAGLITSGCQKGSSLEQFSKQLSGAKSIHAEATLKLGTKTLPVSILRKLPNQAKTTSNEQVALVNDKDGWLEVDGNAKKYATKARPVDKLAEISLQALVGKIVLKNKDFIFRFEVELEKAFGMNQMYFLIVPDSFPGVAEEISVAFTRLVVIKEQTGFDSNYHSSLITDYEKIKECLEKVFSTSFS